MKKILITLSILLLCSLSKTASSQELHMDEIIKMTKLPLQKIDSIVTSKKFVLVNHDSDKTFVMYHYDYFEKTDSSVIVRGLTVGKMNKTGYGMDIEYGVFQKPDAIKIINWLLQNGFTKKISILPDLSGKSSVKLISYNKGKETIQYSEEETEPGIIVYLFKLNSLYF